MTILFANVFAFGQGTTSPAKNQRLRTFPLAKFYDTPDPLPKGKAGDLIRKEEFENYELAEGVNAERILYHSRSATGEDVASSGVVLYPDGKIPSGGWPVIAWAHPVKGVARQCAPSLARNLAHGPLLSMYVNLGYAVVATDYAGLGTKYRNAFSDMPSNAADVVYSIAAARAAVPQLASRWVAIGMDEGGLAVIGVAEMEQEIRDQNYLGGIVIAGGSEMQNRYEQAEAGTLLALFYGIKTVYPQFEIKDVLTERGLAAFARVDQSCEGVHAVPDAVKPNWSKNEFVNQYFGRNRPGQKPAYGGLLVIATVPQAGTSNDPTLAVISRMCQQRDRVQFESYGDPGSIVGDSAREQIEWMQGRFAGRQAPSNCSDLH